MSPVRAATATNNQHVPLANQFPQPKPALPKVRPVGASLPDLFHDYVIDSSLLMLAGLASLTLFTQIVLYHKPQQTATTTTTQVIQNNGGFSVELDWMPFWVVFFEALLIYTTDHLRDYRKLQVSKRLHENVNCKKAYNNIAWVKILQKLGAIGLLSALCWRPSFAGVLLVLGHLSLGVLYAFPLKQFCIGPKRENAQQPVFSQRKLRLKDIPYFKSFFVAWTVSIMVIACPLVYYRDPTTGVDSWIQGFHVATRQPTLLLQVWTVIFVMALFVENAQDVRDIAEDWANGTKTLPVGFGIRRTKEFLFLAIPSVVTFVMLLDFATDNHGFHVCCVGPHALYCSMLSQMGRRSPARYFSYFETIYLTPLVAHLIVNVWLGLDPFMVPPSILGPDAPLPWHFPLMLSVQIWIAYCNFTYFLSDQDRDDLVLSERRNEGSWAVLISSAGMIIAGIGMAVFFAPRPSFRFRGGDDAWSDTVKLAAFLAQAVIVIGGLIVFAKEGIQISSLNGNIKIVRHERRASF